jgi:hypothetical protein
MDYEKNNEALDIVKRMVADGQVSQEVAEKYFPELKESEDEKIRKALIFHFQGDGYLCNKVGNIPNTDILAWLEKQGSEPNWYHHKVDLPNCSEEYRKAYYDGWNNCSMQYSQCKSEGNDVVKCLINGMKFYYEDNEEATWGTEKFSMKVKDILSWLEKQGKDNMGISEATKQELKDNLNKALEKETPESWNKFLDEQCEKKPADKIEPKFKVGDWIVQENIGVYKVTEICESWYEVIDGEDNHYSISFDKEYMCHFWTIQDAKDGDVLAADNYIILFKKLLPQNGGVSYCHYDYACSDPYFNFNEDNNWYFGKESKIHPATKEQHELLFQKMKEAGYWWDAEKKELKMIEQKPIWSEEDERIINSCIYCFEQDLKELKNDKVGHSEIISDLEEGYKEKIDFLKSLKDRVQPQNTWKPSDEQMEALDGICSYIRNKADWEISQDTIHQLYSLSEQLKKLKE